MLRRSCIFRLPPPPLSTLTNNITNSPRSSNPGTLGRSLYRRILKELRATRNYDHHLRDIRFLLWVPGTKGKRQYDELKRLAQMSSSLHPSRKKEDKLQPEEQQIKKKIINSSPSIADQIRAVAGGLFRKERDKLKQLDASLENKKKDFLESLLKRSKEIKEQGGSSASTTATTSLPTTPPPTPTNFASLQTQLAVNKATQIQEGTKRAFWAIKRLQDIRAGVVPNASMWLATTSSVAPPTPFSLHAGTGVSPSAAGLSLLPQNTPYLAQYQLQQQQQLAAAAAAGSSSSSSASSLGEEFDPFLIPKEAQMRGGNFPFLHEFLGLVVGENNQELLEELHLKKLRREGRRRPRKQLLLQQQQQQQQASSESPAAEQKDSEDIIEEYLDTLDTFGKSENKVLKLELISRCASAEGPSARYHLSFRLENVSETAVDVKLAHLFAVQCQTPCVLNEMVCLLPLFGNSILSPYSVSAFDQEQDEDGEEETNDEHVGDKNVDTAADQKDENENGNELTRENLKSVRRKRGGQEQQEQNPEEAEEEKQPVEENEEKSQAPHHEFVRKMRQQQQQQKTAQHASLPYINHSKSSNRSSVSAPPEFTAKSKAPDHCAVYDVSFPIQGECVLRGFILYRTITNAFPSAEVESGKAPSTVKSRLKVLHLPLIKLSPPDSQQ